MCSSPHTFSLTLSPFFVFVCLFCALLLPLRFFLPIFLSLFFVAGEEGREEYVHTRHRENRDTQRKEKKKGATLYTFMYALAQHTINGRAESTRPISTGAQGLFFFFVSFDVCVCVLVSLSLSFSLCGYACRRAVPPPPTFPASYPRLSSFLPL